MHKMELHDKLLKEKQEWIHKLAEIEELDKNLVIILKDLESQQNLKEHKKNDENLIRIITMYKTE